MKTINPDATSAPPAVSADGLQWISPSQPPLRLSGFPWFAQDRVYRRLPVAPHWPLRDPVDLSADQTAGGQVQFQTDSGRCAVRVRLKGPANMNHMPATGQCGCDLYLGPPKAQRFCNVTKYNHTEVAYEATLFELSRERRNVTLNFPLYQGVAELSIGLDADARILPPPPFDEPRPVVVYGTSITQGGCASRPGMAYTNILSRRFNRPFVNLGFSGQGWGDAAVAHLMGEIDNASGYVLDYETNAAGQQRLQKTLHAFIRILRDARPDTPIVVVSRPRFARDLFQPDSERGRRERLEFQRRTVRELRAEGLPGLHFVDGAPSQGDDFDECTVDGVHPTDFGFWRMAQFLYTALRPILNPPSSELQ